MIEESIDTGMITTLLERLRTRRLPRALDWYSLERGSEQT